MKVSKKFIEEYVSSFNCFGGQICKEDLVNGDFTISDTTLTRNNICDIKSGLSTLEKFRILVANGHCRILVANGHGWGTAWLCDDGALLSVNDDRDNR